MEGIIFLAAVAVMVWVASKFDNNEPRPGGYDNGSFA